MAAINSIYLSMILLMGPLLCWSQEWEEKTSKIRIELGAGYQYAALTEFNKEFVSGQYLNLYSRELHSGWTAKTNFTYEMKQFLYAGVDFSYRNYHISGSRKNLSYIDPEPGGPNYTYDLREDIKLNNLAFGIRTTIYFDQLKETNKSTKINYGLELIGNYALSKYTNTRTTYLWSQGEGSSKITTVNINHLNIGFGLNIKYRFNNDIFQAIIFRCGLNKSINSIIRANEAPLYLIEDLKVDFSGIYLNLCLELGWKRII